MNDDVVVELAHLLVPWAPALVVAAVAYLAVNDALDVLLASQALGGGLSGLRRVGVQGAIEAITHDVVSDRVLAATVVALLPVLGAGGDVRAGVVAVLVALAAANIGNLESSTLAKVRKLLGVETASKIVPPGNSPG